MRVPRVESWSGVGMEGKVRAGEAMIIWIQNGSALVVLSSVQDGLAHAVGVLRAGPLALPHVDVGGHLLPARLDIQLRVFFLQVGLLPEVVLGALQLLLFLPRCEFLELLLALLFPLLLFRPLSILSK